MALTYFNLEKEHVVNHYRLKPLKGGFLLTNDFGFWVYLSKDEFDSLRHGKIDDNQPLFSLLKEKGFILTQSNSEKLINDFRQCARHLSRGAYKHIIFLDDGNSENIKKIADFIMQSPSMELIVKFKGKILHNFEMIKNFVEEFRQSAGKKISFEVEADLANLNGSHIDFLINNKFDVWFPIKNINFSNETFGIIKDLQRRHNINFYLDASPEILGKEQEIIDFFVENNFKSFFIRKTKEVSKGDFLDFWKRMMDLTYETNKKLGRAAIQEQFANILLRKITNIHDASYPELNNMCCGAVISELAYNLKGEIYANEECYGIELFKIGNVNLDYNSVVLGEDAMALLSTSINGDAALEINPYKPFIGSCPVCNYLESSNIIGRQPSERTAILTEMLDYLFEGVLFGENFLSFV